jgi:hypothetical protein
MADHHFSGGVMSNKLGKRFLAAAGMLLLFMLPAAAQKEAKKCFGSDARASALLTTKVWMQPDAGYDPVTGYGSEGARRGAPPADVNGLAQPIACVANKKLDPGSGTTPKFYCSVAGVADDDGELIRYKIKPHFKGQSPDKRNGEIYGEFLSSRFSKALGFFADDEWVADVSCPDCEKSLTTKFQGIPFSGTQSAAGIELGLGKGLDTDCNGKDSAPLESGIAQAEHGGASRAEVDAFKLWLAFIDHGDTKSDNHKFACLKTSQADGSLQCSQVVFYVSDMGSTFGFSSASEGKARLDKWKGKDPIRIDGGRCNSTAKSIGNSHVTEAGRSLLATQLQLLLDAERANGTITKVFQASRNSERDQPAPAWTAEFIRKANTIINARCKE